MSKLGRLLQTAGAGVDVKRTLPPKDDTAEPVVQAFATAAMVAKETRRYLIILVLLLFYW